jgi:hypothetical protein
MWWRLIHGLVYVGSVYYYIQLKESKGRDLLQDKDRRRDFVP